MSGGERSTLHFRDLEAGTDLADEVPDTYYGLAWANDSSTVFYVRPDDAMRPFQIWRHTIGSPATDDVLVYTETDDRFYVGVGRTRTGRFIVISSESKLTSEVRLIDADNPTAPPQVVAPREQGVEYHVEHHHDEEHGDRLYILTNADGAVNFKVLLAASPTAARDTWTEVVAHRDDVRLENVDAFADYLVVSERSGGIERIRVRSLADDSEHEVAMPDEVYSAWVGPNPEFETATLRLGYTSLVAPTRDLAYDVEARSLTVVKEQDVPGYDASQYETHREWATAPDGVQGADLDRSPCQRPGTADAAAPLLLYGYGSYEISIDPTFSVSRLSLLQRGMAFAIAHVRGGGELGRRWYDDGKLDHKTNTFTDFIACAEHLVAIGVTHPDRLVARGGSAGGLAHGCDREPAAKPVPGDRRRGPVRRRAHDDARRNAAAHRHGVGGVGQPRRQRRHVQVHEELLALRQRDRAALPGAPGHRGAQRPARAVLGTGEVGREAALDGDGRWTDLAQDRARRGPPRPVGSLRDVARRGVRPRVRPRPVGRRRRSAS